jgi:LPXTG-motif cell wall-anchored protein
MKNNFQTSLSNVIVITTTIAVLTIPFFISKPIASHAQIATKVNCITDISGVEICPKSLPATLTPVATNQAPTTLTTTTPSSTTSNPVVLVTGTSTAKPTGELEKIQPTNSISPISPIIPVVPISSTNLTNPTNPTISVVQNSVATPVQKEAPIQNTMVVTTYQPIVEVENVSVSTLTRTGGQENYTFVFSMVVLLFILGGVFYFKRRNSMNDNNESNLNQATRIKVEELE